MTPRRPFCSPHPVIFLSLKGHCHKMREGAYDPKESISKPDGAACKRNDFNL